MFDLYDSATVTLKQGLLTNVARRKLIGINRSYFRVGLEIERRDDRLQLLERVTFMLIPNNLKRQFDLSTPVLASD